MGESRLRKGILQILSANILNLIFGVGTALILPKFLPVESYSQIKTYQLYISYTAIFHLGYNDGMILKYGGRRIETMNLRELQEDLSTVRNFQVVMTLLCMLTGFFLKDTALFFAACTILPINMITYFKNLYQAVGKFEKYSNILNWTTILTFLINILLVGIIRTDQFVFYLAGYVFLNAWIWIRLEVLFCKTLHLKFIGRKFSRVILKDNISNGFLLLTANLASILLTGIDRFFVKGFLSAADFAKYAFVASMENLLNVVVTPVSISLYNHFCVNHEKEDLENAQEMIICFGAVVVTGAFAVRFILETILQEYLDASKTLFLLFAAHLFMTIIKCLYVNLYKAKKQQKKYSEKLAIVLVMAVVLNGICFMVNPVKESFAVGTLLTSVLWFLLCQYDFPEIRCSLRQYLFLISEMTVFLFCGLRMNVILGGGIYLVFTYVMIGVCMPGVWKKILKFIKVDNL